MLLNTINEVRESLKNGEVTSVSLVKESIETFEKAQKSKILNKKLEVEVPDSIFEELKELVGE